MASKTCNGFLTAGISSGLKKNGDPDLGVIISTVSANITGVFTRNKVQAAPVILDRERIKSGKFRAVIANSGNANCCLGEKGLKDAKRMTGTVATSLDADENLIYVASTGVIGEPFPIEKVESAIPRLMRAAGPDGVDDFARAIMTTDTVPKVVNQKGCIDDTSFSITGIAKGAGMIRPDMATMLCFIYTDLDVSAPILQDSLRAATEKTMNRITIDGDTSTNDTVLLMANGLSGAVVKNKQDRRHFQELLDDVMIQLAKMLVRDGEGATKLVKIIVKGAVSIPDARQGATVIAHSNLVKTALFGEDANWGRILAAVGRAGIRMSPDKTDILFNDIMMVQGGRGLGEKAEEKATAVLKQSEFTIQVNLNMGSFEEFIYTCDFSVDYVKINADYRS